MVSLAQDRQLKPGWTWVRFGDVVRLSNARCVDPLAKGIERYVGLEHIDPDDLRIRRWGLVEDGITFTSLFKPGQVLFGKRRAYLRKVAVADFEGVCSGDIYVFESANPQVLLPELLPFICQTDRFFEHAIGTSAGSLSPRTNWKNLVNFEFALPPLEEQKSIVKLTSNKDTFLNFSQQSIDKISSIKQSLLTNIFGCYKAPNKDWQCLQDCCAKIADGTHQSPKFIDEGIPFLLISNISSGILDTEIKKWISNEEYKYLTKNFLPSKGDILYSLVGSYGIPIYVDWDWQFLFQRHIGIIRVDESKLNSKYLYYFLQSLPALYQANQLAEGLAQKTITLTSLRSFLIPIPKLKEQKYIASQFDKIDYHTSLLLNRKNNLSEIVKLIIQKKLI